MLTICNSLAINQKSISLLVGITKAHCTIGRTSERMGIFRGGSRGNCMDEEEEESVQYLLSDCPALQQRSPSIFFLTWTALKMRCNLLGDSHELEVLE